MLGAGLEDFESLSSGPHRGLGDGGTHCGRRGPRPPLFPLSMRREWPPFAAGGALGWQQSGQAFGRLCFRGRSEVPQGRKRWCTSTS